MSWVTHLGAKLQMDPSGSQTWKNRQLLQFSSAPADVNFPWNSRCDVPGVNEMRLHWCKDADKRS